MTATALAADEPSEPEITYENYREHYREHMTDVARAVAFAVEGPYEAERGAV